MVCPGQPTPKARVSHPRVVGQFDSLLPLWGVTAPRRVHACSISRRRVAAPIATAVEFGCHRTTVAEGLKKAGIVMRLQSPEAVVTDAMESLHRSGLSYPRWEGNLCMPPTPYGSTCASVNQRLTNDKVFTKRYGIFYKFQCIAEYIRHCRLTYVNIRIFPVVPAVFDERNPLRVQSCFRPLCPLKFGSNSSLV